MFFSQATIGKKNIKKHTKTNILLFSADIHTYKLTFVSFFMFFLTFPLNKPKSEKKHEDFYLQFVFAVKNASALLWLNWSRGI